MTLATGLLVGCSEPVLIGRSDTVGSSGGAGFGGAGGSIGDAPIDTNPDVSTGGSAGTDSGEEDVSADQEGGEGGAGAAGNPGQAVCGALHCGAGSQCCYLTAKCFDPLAHPEACPKPGSSSKACGADSHCKPWEFCTNTNKYMCMGQGECVSMDPDKCVPFYTMDTCGCDGVTRWEYHSCTLGLRALAAPFPVPCGSIPLPSEKAAFCGNNSAWCPHGTDCCVITGWCVELSKMGTLCNFPDAGMFFPCEVDDDCHSSGAFCQGPTCGAPGGCIRRPNKTHCDGVFDPVCGCDGKTRLNLCWSQADGVPLDHLGPCPDSGL